MNQLSDLIALLAFAAVAGLWFKSTRARERAVDEARRQCLQHDLQLLDETVGLRSLRLRRVDGRRQLEVGYGFEVSVQGDDRQEGRLWMRGDRLARVSLPGIGGTARDTTEPAAPAAGPQLPERPGNVVPLRPRRPRTGH
ncbi:MAG TPA: DUF3301 domain-containing protein [Frateuria sp.]|uniref:DUF3301 domain-containing protein n=1 Tax=Frateuria sp. TaxID=2211372 RepID=UPI002DE30F05|nr:DUF3301 domain-containing protein [Frateuria sp.]